MKTKDIIFRGLFLWSLAAMIVMSCSGDDDVLDDDPTVDPSEEQLSAMEIETDEDAALFDVLRFLTDIDVSGLKSDWKTKTYEPSYGSVVDESQPFVRYVVVSDADEAYSEYMRLCFFSNNLTNNYEVGSVKLTYTELNQSDVFATIDVNVPQLPHLTQLRLVPSSAIGANYSSSWSGEPYYLIGDVVLDDDGNYWVCIRAASPGKKGDSYWASMQMGAYDGKTNYNNQYYNKVYPGALYRLPYNLNLGHGDNNKLYHFVDLMRLLSGYGVLDNSNNEYYMRYDLTQDGYFPTGLGRLNDINYYDVYYLRDLCKIWKDVKNRTGRSLWELFVPQGGTIEPGYFLGTDINVIYDGTGGKTIYYKSYPWADRYESDKIREKNAGKYSTFKVVMTGSGSFNIDDYICYGKTRNETLQENQPRQAIVVRLASGEDLAKIPKGYDPRNTFNKSNDVLVHGKFSEQFKK